MINLKNFVKDILEKIKKLAKCLVNFLFLGLFPSTCRLCGKICTGGICNFCQLCKKASEIKMTVEDKIEQRKSFVYGNTKMSNSAITRALVDAFSDRPDKEKK